MGDEVAGAGWAGCAVVVPAGGSSRRMGSDKLAAPLGASTVLGELLGRVPPGVPVVVVGPGRDLPGRSPAVLTVREEPPGAGPAAAVAAGVAVLAAAGMLLDRPARPPWPAGPPAAPPAAGGVDVVVVCAGDAPWSPLAVPSLVAVLRAAPGVGAAVAIDAAGVRQPLLAAHRAVALSARLATGGVAGARAGWLLGPGAVEVPVPEHVLADVDTPEQLAVARARR